MKIDKLNFEEAMAELQKVVEALDNSNTSLDDSISLYKKGLELSKYCDEKLSSVEKEIATIITPDGEKDFVVEGE